MWKPKEIIVNEAVKTDPATIYFLKQCNNIPVQYIKSGLPKDIIRASKILNNAGSAMLERILSGKKVVYIAPPVNVVDSFTMPDNRMMCPHFNRLKLASNGCFYQCDWCYLKLTYRAAFPFITVRAQYDLIKDQIQNRINKSGGPIFFNSGELADSLSMEHLTRAAQEFIPWFGQTDNGFLFMLTKSDMVDDILNLPHNDHTIITWSMNNDIISRKFEIGAPSFEQRLKASSRVQVAGYPLRIRLDPIVPFVGWQKHYSNTIRKLFKKISPERITLGTLRFEKGFYNMRQTIFTTGPELPKYLDEMTPMFSPKILPGLHRPTSGKFSFSETKRIKIFRFIINEIRKYSDCKIALCKESAEVWKKLNLDLSKCSCVCQLNSADLSIF